MKSNRLSLLLLLLVAVLLLMGGCSRHYVDVYINSKCFLVAIDNGNVIDPLVVFPEDYVIFTNLTDDVVIMDLPAGVFSEDHVEIAIGKRVILKVIQKDPGGGSLVLNCTGGSGSPKVVVGEEP